ncbi:GNAT family N-acetyltransferase [Undibacter mobilis]|uniref:L-ornithine N(alpha)-acyltransferase n=2 Tax=Undibacter mobilis TaxID=2292256 RepID=A0A371B9H6_9BRAD|nr:GNAT family N-acetyltransferase [Undibacter mobilis]
MMTSSQRDPAMMRDSATPTRNPFSRRRAAPAAPGLISSLQAYGGLQAWAARAHRPLQSLGRIGSLEVRLAQTAAEVRQAQKLRYRVFYQEGTAIPNPGRLFARRDVDGYDAICDHLLVLDHAAREGTPGNRPAVVGTYRLLRQALAEDHGGFYTAGEFDISGLIERHRNLQFLELGRSCVLAPYRNKRTVELLWHGIHAYITQNRCDVMIGCASLDGTEPKRLALPLSFLHHYARAPEEWRAQALPERYVEMNRISKESIDPKEALRQLPPLVKGYLRLGAYIGDGAVVDHEFGTTDVLIVLPVSVIKQRYIEHFDLGRRAA